VRVLVVGSGGREHALAHGLARSPEVEEVIGAPGNPGIATLGRCLPVNAGDPDYTEPEHVMTAEEKAGEYDRLQAEAPAPAGKGTS